MFANPCLGRLKYEATTSAIVLAGLFLSFLIDYVGQRVISCRAAKATSCSNGNDLEHIQAQRAAQGQEPGSDPSTSNIKEAADHGHATLADPEDKLSVLTLEAGIIFHSTSE